MKKFLSLSSFSKQISKCEGSSALVVTYITPEIIQKFIAAVTMYCVHKQNTCKNITSWIVASLVSFNETVFTGDSRIIKNAILHIKDPRDEMTFGWLDSEENLLTLRFGTPSLVQQLILPTDYICKTGKKIQKLSPFDKAKFTIKVVSILSGGWDQLIPGLDQIIDLIPSDLQSLYDLTDFSKERLKDLLIRKAVEDNPVLEMLNELYRCFKDASEGEGGVNSLQTLDYSQDVFTSEDKENLTRILKTVWLDHLKSNSNFSQCKHDFTFIPKNPPTKECSLCKTEQECRFSCLVCSSDFCKVCFGWNKKWTTCPINHEFNYVDFYGIKYCQSCSTPIKGKGFEDAECRIYLHAGCGPFELKLYAKDDHKDFLCHCNSILQPRVGKKAYNCTLCRVKSKGGLKCKKCCIKFCLNCTNRNLKTLKTI